MALTEAKKQEWDKTLREIGLLEDGDVIEEHTAGDYWEITGQTRGNYFFTRDGMIFVSGFGITNFKIRYSDIREIKKTFVGPFIPTGIKITAMDPQKGKTKKYKCSVTKRKQWMELLSKKSGVSC